MKSVVLDGVTFQPILFATFNSGVGLGCHAGIMSALSVSMGSPMTEEGAIMNVNDPKVGALGRKLGAAVRHWGSGYAEYSSVLMFTNAGFDPVDVASAAIQNTLSGKHPKDLGVANGRIRTHALWVFGDNISKEKKGWAACSAAAIERDKIGVLVASQAAINVTHGPYGDQRLCRVWTWTPPLYENCSVVGKTVLAPSPARDIKTVKAASLKHKLGGIAFPHDPVLLEGVPEELEEPPPPEADREPEPVRAVRRRKVSAAGN